MRNPTTLTPESRFPLRTIDAAFQSRSQALQETVRAATLVGRILHMARRDSAAAPATGLAQPSMSWFDGPRVQPRGRNGKFLSKAWLADAELFLPADRAWFRAPLTEGK